MTDFFNLHVAELSYKYKDFSSIYSIPGKVGVEAVFKALSSGHFYFSLAYIFYSLQSQL